MKSLLRSVAAPFLPDAITTRSKWGFFAPVHYWMKGALEEFTRSILTQETVERVGYFPYAPIRDMLKSQNQPFPLWSLLTFHMWYTEYIEKGYGRTQN